MGSILSCDCSAGNKEVEYAKFTPIQGFDEENFVKFRESTIREGPNKSRVPNSERKSTLDQSKNKGILYDSPPQANEIAEN